MVKVKFGFGNSVGYSPAVVFKLSPSGDAVFLAMEQTLVLPVPAVNGKVFSNGTLKHPRAHKMFYRNMFKH